MNLLPKRGTDFAKKDYWTEFFDKRKDPFEWYGSYLELSEYFMKYVKQNDEILMVGCGNSELSDELHDMQKCKLITNVDISENVIKRMQKKAEDAGREMIYDVGDVTNLKYRDEQFNCVIDKGTLDAMMVDGSDSTCQLIARMFDEIERCIKTGGRYILITLAQEHIAKFVAQEFDLRIGWMVRLHEHTPVQNEDGVIPLPVFVFIFTRVKPKSDKKLPKLMEIFPAGEDTRPMRVYTGDEISEFVKSRQEWSQLKGLVQRTLSNEVHFSMYAKGKEIPRFDLYIVDDRRGNKDMGFFIVQTGREFDWCYNTQLGRKQFLEELREMTGGGFKRMVYVLKNMVHEYGSQDHVKEELSWLVKELKHKNCRDRNIPFLTEGEDQARNVIATGKSELSGDYLIEESIAKGKDGEECRYRRLVFKKNPTLIQSECKIKVVEERVKKGKKKVTKVRKIFDSCYVASEYYYGLVAAMDMAVKKIPEPKVLIIGLGGGCLTNYLDARYPDVSLTSVEIDPDMVKVARVHFNLSESCKVVVGDGLKFLEENKEEKYDLVILDVDQKDPSLALRCPPEQFITDSALEMWKDGLRENGVLAINLVCRHTEQRGEIIKRCQKSFSTAVVGDCTEGDINKTLLLSKSDIRKDLAHAVKSSKWESEEDSLTVSKMFDSLRF